MAEHLGTMTYQAMADELGTTRGAVADIVYKWRRSQNIPTVEIGEAICWECKKATDFAQCIWVDTLEEMPDGVVTKNGTIMECPEFEPDEERKKNEDGN